MNQGPSLPAAPVTVCKHHWVLGQPDAGQIRAVCKLCGDLRFYPAVLDDLDPGVEPDSKQSPFVGPGMGQGVATAVGGVRPSSVAFSEAQDDDAVADGALLGESES